jgi:hypothetical protein
MFKGFFGRDSIATIGGVVGAGIVGPMIGRYIPDSIRSSKFGPVLASLVVGLAGYLALRKFSRPAALGWAAGVVGPTVQAYMPRLNAPAGTAGLGYGYDDADDDVSGLGFTGGATGTRFLNDDGAAGLGEFNRDAVEYIAV